MQSHVRLRRSRGRLLALLVGAAVVLPPWIVYLAVSLPDQHDSEQWKLVWVGFDIALLACLVAAGWLGARRRRRAVPVLVANATLMLCDAWFDVMLSWHAADWWTSVVMAVVVEVPLAVFLFVRAHLLLAVPKRRHTVTARDIREVLAHPLRQRIMAELDETGVTAEAVAQALGLDRRLAVRVADLRAAGRPGYLVAPVQRGHEKRGGTRRAGRGTGARRTVVVVCLGHLRHSEGGAGAEHGCGGDRRRQPGTLRAEHGFLPLHWRPMRQQRHPHENRIWNGSSLCQDLFRRVA